MALCLLPKDILWEMYWAGVLPPEVIIAGRLDGATQRVECTLAMAEWCREEARRHQDDSQRAADLVQVAGAIEACARRDVGSPRL